MLSLATMMAPSASAFTVAPSIRPVVASPRVASSPTAMDLPFDIPFSTIAEILDSEGERMYGAVDAPSWVAPVGGIAVIATALLPVLLAPGEQAFNQQQGIEQEVSQKFGKGKGTNRPRK